MNPDSLYAPSGTFNSAASVNVGSGFFGGDPGHLILLFIGVPNGITISTPADWTALTTVQSNTAANWYSFYAYFRSGMNTTFTFSGSTSGCFFAQEVRSANLAVAPTVTVQVNGTSSTTITAPNSGATNSGDMQFLAFCSSATATITNNANCWGNGQVSNNAKTIYLAGRRFRTTAAMQNNATQNVSAQSVTFAVAVTRKQYDRPYCGQAITTQSGTASSFTPNMSAAIANGDCWMQAFVYSSGVTLNTYPGTLLITNTFGSAKMSVTWGMGTGSEGSTNGSAVFSGSTTYLAVGAIAQVGTFAMSGSTPLFVAPSQTHTSAAVQTNGYYWNPYSFASYTDGEHGGPVFCATYGQSGVTQSFGYRGVDFVGGLGVGSGLFRLDYCSLGSYPNTVSDPSGVANGSAAMYVLAYPSNTNVSACALAGMFTANMPPRGLALLSA